MNHIDNVWWEVAGIFQLGERRTEDLKVTRSIQVHRKRKQTLSSDTFEYIIWQELYEWNEHMVMYHGNSMLSAMFKGESIRLDIQR